MHALGGYASVSPQSCSRPKANAKASSSRCRSPRAVEPAAALPPATASFCSSLAFMSFILLLFPPVARAYVPAQPTNDTSYLDKTDASKLTIRYSFPPREYAGPVSYQLRSDTWVSDTTRGALVHFTEASVRAAASQNTTVTTPWIAYISCDGNETDASEWDDIFTLARDRGAVSALLFSITSEACVLTQEYIQDFEKPLDVFATVSRVVASTFDSQWTWTNETFHTYNAALLNESAADLNTTLAGQALYHRTYLGGILTSRNGTAQAISRPPPQPTGSQAAGHASKKNNALIALYVIAGFLAAMVCITIISVIRRSRQPVGDAGQRPNDRGESDAPVRRVGLAQAIVDTFPLQRFSKPTGKQLRSQSDLELELPEYPPAAFKRADSSTIASSSLSPMTDSRGTSVDLCGATTDDDHCPICLLEFETGDNLRILPCAVQHRFHQACVDPWLLRVSTSCPLCRKDFNPEVDVDSSSEDEGTPTVHTGSPRVTSRYLALISLARRRNRARSSVPSENTDRPLRPREADQNGPGGY